ncbi:hypothetical protein K0M31_011838 [Melipona bicolor]|uniref:Uncharacterized protein n=1 Tax=Melipona bicolor TaxID=60889 RepID=A0AA40GAB3_9HYME|nr:hypothetical protein K0M31_011838 [Melipona bicolor]
MGLANVQAISNSQCTAMGNGPIIKPRRPGVSLERLNDPGALSVRASVRYPCFRCFDASKASGTPRINLESIADEPTGGVREKIRSSNGYDGEQIPEHLDIPRGTTQYSPPSISVAPRFRGVQIPKWPRLPGTYIPTGTADTRLGLTMYTENAVSTSNSFGIQAFSHRGIYVPSVSILYEVPNPKKFPDSSELTFRRTARYQKVGEAEGRLPERHQGTGASDERGFQRKEEAELRT